MSLSYISKPISEPNRFFSFDFVQKEGEQVRGNNFFGCKRSHSLHNFYKVYVNSFEKEDADEGVWVSDSPYYYISKIDNIKKGQYIYFTDSIKKERTNSILNLFEQQRSNGKVYEYLCTRMHDFLEDDPEAYFDDNSFIGLYKFTEEDSFSKIDFSLQLGEYGRACLQRTFKNGFVYIEFVHDDCIFYNIMTQNTDILHKGTFNDFFKHLAENPIRN